MLENDMYITNNILCFKVGSGNNQTGISLLKNFMETGISLLKKFMETFGIMRLISRKMTLSDKS